jgi:hypothetical protein
MSNRHWSPNSAVAINRRDRNRRNFRCVRLLQSIQKSIPVLDYLRRPGIMIANLLKEEPHGRRI